MGWEEMTMPSHLHSKHPDIVFSFCLEQQHLFYSRCADLLMPVFIFHDILTQKANICPSPCRRCLKEGASLYCLGERLTYRRELWYRKGQRRLASPSQSAQYNEASLSRLERNSHAQSRCFSCTHKSHMFLTIMSSYWHGGLLLALFPENCALARVGLYVKAQ